MHYVDRPFAQLAFFTDFQQTGNTQNAPYFPDISAATLFLDATYRLPWELYLRANLDLNLVFAEGAAPFTYPFYQFDFGWEPAPGNRIAVLVTNKGMDYQLHYPTHQLIRSPSIGLSATRDLPAWQKKMWRRGGIFVVVCEGKFQGNPQPYLDFIRSHRGNPRLLGHP